MSKQDKIIDADQLATSLITAKTVCDTVSVPRQDNLIDCDARQIERNEIRPRVVEDVWVA